MPMLYGKRVKGLPSVPAKKNRLQLCGAAPPIDWEMFRGDLQSLRNKLGILVPQSLRFVNYSYFLDKQRTSIHNTKYADLMTYLVDNYQQRAELNRPYFQDPYGRSTSSNTVKLAMKNLVTPQLPIPDGMETLSQGRVRSRQVLIRQAMQDVAIRRENQRRLDAVVWGRQSMDEKEFFASVKKKSSVKPISLRLYQAKDEKPKKSEWTKNMELAQALSRKSDICQSISQRLQKHESHGDLVRMQKNNATTEKYSKLMTTLHEKEDHHQELVQKIKAARSQAYVSTLEDPSATQTVKHVDDSNENRAFGGAIRDNMNRAMVGYGNQAIDGAIRDNINRAMGGDTEGQYKSSNKWIC